MADKLNPREARRRKLAENERQFPELEATRAVITKHALDSLPK